jgi:hypothetical protein
MEKENIPHREKRVCVLYTYVLYMTHTKEADAIGRNKSGSSSSSYLCTFWGYYTKLFHHSFVIIQLGKIFEKEEETKENKMHAFQKGFVFGPLLFQSLIISQFSHCRRKWSGDHPFHLQ